MAGPSIDRKLPLLASGLVLLTALALVTAAHVSVDRALIASAQQRLLTTARVAAQRIQRPSARTSDPAARAADRTLREFLAGRLSESEAARALEVPMVPGDTTHYYSALLNPNGYVLLEYKRQEAPSPRWAPNTVARGAARGDTLLVGPLEIVANLPAVTTMRPVNDSSAGVRRIGYIVESRIITSNRSASQFRDMIGAGLELLVGQPGVGAWTDLERVAAAPPVRINSDSALVVAGTVAATARVPGTDWMVWVSQPESVVLAPARQLLWGSIPIAIAIALAGAAIMYLMTRRITHPIVELTEAAENVARDGGPLLEPRTQMPVKADEVARLRFAFERMAQRVSERQTLELQLRHAQKMEAVGRLAGGVAHDFNNLLTAIRSYADLMLDDMPAWDPKRGDALEIRNAAQRAAALTAQLLAFSRKQMLQPRVLETAQVITEIRGMLQRLLLEDLQLKLDVADGLWRVRADRGQLEQVIVNLAVNARDAMPNGGLLHISGTNEVVTTAIAARNGVVPPGEYVKICVQDSGVGMDTATMARAFEPFFTNKPTGHGTGLGLSTVDGIVAQSGGYVTIDSALQRGTTICVYLPRVTDAVDSESRGGAVPQRGNSETILLVEDELSVRALARRVLEKTGYRVLESSSPSDALRLAQANRAEIDLIVSDVVMPEMNGPAMVSRVLEHCPNARVLFISGYADEDVIGRGLQNPGMTLLPKPFSAQELVERVRQVLDEGVTQKA
jgi:signal transduction histidine kinase/CheY-like chemotaxis protein